jgi:NADH:ubiquinone oxidoreductase subunit 5 (subunit L)/multisubunit Na+/H+ antiporter MnhA subunit
MVVGNIIWNNISRDLSQYGGMACRPVSGICYLVGAASLVALPPLVVFGHYSPHGRSPRRSQWFTVISAIVGQCLNCL